jgi:hypothetical protein
LGVVVEEESETNPAKLEEVKMTKPQTEKRNFEKENIIVYIVEIKD